MLFREATSHIVSPVFASILSSLIVIVIESVMAFLQNSLFFCRYFSSGVSTKVLNSVIINVYIKNLL